ncbi:MAG: helix-turn-helix transcriptional regulator [Calditrichaceae bacterium]
MLLLNNINTSMHSHYALEIYMALETPFQMDFGNGDDNYQGLIINSNIPHRFSGNNGTCALILINPKHPLANKISNNILNGNAYKHLDLRPFQDILVKLSNLQNESLSYEDVRQLVAGLLITLTRDSSKMSSTDPRVKKAISEIHHTYKQTIELSHLASSTRLSPSRLRHLFKEETGITVRQYILNMRVTEAVKLIINGHSKTYAAHESGFSDAAHLSRTFRNVYGLTLSDLYKYNQNINVHYCPQPEIE